MLVKTLDDKFIDVEEIEFNVDNTVDLIFKGKSKKNVPVNEITSIRNEE